MADIQILTFTGVALLVLRQNYTMVHSVYSGFNRLIRWKYPDIDPVTLQKQLSAEGHVELLLVRGGANLLSKIDLAEECFDPLLVGTYAKEVIQWKRENVDTFRK